MKNEENGDNKVLSLGYKLYFLDLEMQNNWDKKYNV